MAASNIETNQLNASVYVSALLFHVSEVNAAVTYGVYYIIVPGCGWVFFCLCLLLFLEIGPTLFF